MMPLSIWSADPAWNDFALRWGAGVLIFLSTTALSYVLGRWWGARQAQRDWRQKQLLGRVNISLNSFRDGCLRIRTIFERSLDEVFLNPVAVQQVRLAARRTTRDNPLLPIDPKDRWFLLNFVLNAVAERFAGGVIRADAGRPVETVAYLIFLTCEQEGDDRIRKVRALMIQEKQLREFPYPDPSDMPTLEADYHKDRLDTLRKAADLYRKERDLFIRMEVCV